MSLHLKPLEMLFRRIICAACLVAPSLWPAAASADAAPAVVPSRFAGQWQVRQVLVDERQTGRLLYQVDDPRLVGRMLSVDTRRIDADLPEAAACEQPGGVPGQLTLDTLLSRTMPELPSEGAARLFDANLPGVRPLDLAWITCQTGTFGPELQGGPRASQGNAAGGGVWLALLPKGEALLPWYGHTLLVLQRTPADAEVKPSFACAKARSPTEKAICASPALASYDSSVAKGWAYAVQYCDRDAPCIAAARRDQKQWVATRDRCGDDKTCLRKAMRERLDVLMTPAADE